jgi:hypothetical protein
MPHPYSTHDAEGWIALATSAKPTSQFALTIRGEVVGGIGLRLDDPARKGVFRHSAELGYWLGEPFWGARHHNARGNPKAWFPRRATIDDAVPSSSEPSGQPFTLRP